MCGGCHYAHAPRTSGRKEIRTPQSDRCAFSSETYPTLVPCAGLFRSQSPSPVNLSRSFAVSLARPSDSHSPATAFDSDTYFVLFRKQKRKYATHFMAERWKSDGETITWDLFGVNWRFVLRKWRCDPIYRIACSQLFCWIPP